MRIPGKAARARERGHRTSGEKLTVLHSPRAFPLPVLFPPDRLMTVLRLHCNTLGSGIIAELFDYTHRCPSSRWFLHACAVYRTVTNTFAFFCHCCNFFFELPTRRSRQIGISVLSVSRVFLYLGNLWHIHSLATTPAIPATPLVRIKKSYFLFSRLFVRGSSFSCLCFL